MTSFMNGSLVTNPFLLIAGCSSYNFFCTFAIDPIFGSAAANCRNTGIAYERNVISVSSKKMALKNWHKKLVCYCIYVFYLCTY